MENRLKKDLEDIIRLTDISVWEALKNRRLFITGGTGFFGTWILEAIAFANQQHHTNIKADVLTRNVSKFEKKAPHLFESPHFTFIEGDVKNLEVKNGDYDFVIHAATEASETLNNNNPLEMMDTIVEGTRNILEFCKAGKIDRMLFVSSGAVYGKQPVSVSHIQEDFAGGPSVVDSRNVYAESKRLAELMCCVYADKYAIEIPIARCFAFVGPYLNLNIHFAIGNFIRDGLEGREIEIKGDGTPTRSYLYAADLVIWLLTVLVKGETKRAYNVGSDHAVSIEELAKTVCECFENNITYVVRQKPDPSKERQQYIPSIERVKRDLGLKVNFGLTQSIRRTIQWNLK